MSCTDFPSAGLIPNVTTHTVGNITYIWTGIAWESQVNVPAGELVNDVSIPYEFDELNDAISFTGAVVGKVANLKERTTGNGGSAIWDYVLASSVTPNTNDIVQCTGVPTLALRLRVSAEEDDLIRSNMYGIPNGADQTNLENFRAKFTSRKNPVAVFPGFQGINNPDCGSVLDLANFGGQGIGGFNPIGFVFHHYSNSRMMQMDNVGANNEILYLKNATNPVRRPDQPADFIGSAKFISLNRQESNGAGGVTGTLEGFYISKDFEMVWPMQATGINSVTLWNNVAASSAIWTHVFKNSNEQQYLLSVDNDGTRPFKVEWVSAAQTTVISGHKGVQVEAEDGDLILKAAGQVKINQVLELKNYATSTLPALTTAERGSIAYVDNGGGAGNRFPAHWDGTNWLKMSDNTII